MSDSELVQDITTTILTAIERIERRFTGIESPEGFLADDEGIDRRYGITMMLIAIGEQVKRLDRVIEVDLDTSQHVFFQGAVEYGLFSKGVNYLK